MEAAGSGPAKIKAGYRFPPYTHVRPHTCRWLMAHSTVTGSGGRRDLMKLKSTGNI